MRILTSELRKTLTARFFLILVIAVAANFLLFRNDLKNDYRSYSIDTYVTAQRDIMALPEGERLPYLQERARMLSACQSWDTYAALNGSFDMPITEDMLEFQSVYENKGYLKYTDHLYKESGLNRRLLEDVRRVAEHKEALQAAIDDATLKTSLSIYAKPGTFAYRSQLATIDAFREMLSVMPRYDMSDGVLSAMVSPVTDLIGLMLVLLLCTQMVVTEQKNGMLPILRATRKGRLPLIASKIVAVFVLSLLVTLALWGENLAICAHTFGLGDLSRPVQSLTGFTNSTLKISVGEYLAISLAGKWLLYSVVGMLCLSAGLAFGDAMPTWLTVGGFLTVEYILTAISPISKWNHFKYINLGNLIFSNDYLAAYRNLDFFGYPVETLTVSVVLLAVLPVLCIVGASLLFCVNRFRFSGVKLSLRRPKWLPKLPISTRLLEHENWKLMVECGAILVLAVFLVLNLQKPDFTVISSDEMYYKNYMLSLEGPVDENTDAFLQREEARFEGIREEIRSYGELRSEGVITQEEYSTLTSGLTRQLDAEKVLREKVIPKVERAKLMAAEGKNAWLVYDPGYEYLLGLDIYHDKTGAAALVLAGIILCLSNLYPLETTSGMLPLLNTYRRGRMATAVTKLGLSFGAAAILFVLAQIPDYWYVLQNFEFPAVNAPLCSLEAFGGWSDGISILGGIVTYEILRLMTVLTLTSLILLLSLWTKHQIVTMSVSAGVLLMPLLLHLLDIRLLNEISFYLPLTGTGLLAGQQSAGKALLYYGIVLALGAVSTLFTFRYVGCGHRYSGKGNKV